jgi:predicted O-methyltransferase YrrM
LDSKNDLTVSAVRQRALEMLSDYQAAIADIAPEAGFGGVWESEMLLFYAAVKPYAPRQILESGRGRGKSTSILARCFPKAQIISVELADDTPNAIAAAEKLKPFPNVKLLSGDSHRILPEHLQTGDAVLIDGPKDFNAVLLAVEVLQTGKPCAVFMHDFPANAPARKFVARHWPNAFFSDDPALQTLRAIDDARDPLREKRARGYGTFACLPAELPKPLWRLRLALSLARLGL